MTLGHLVKEDSVSVEVVVQRPPLAAAILQGLCQMEGDPYPHRPSHRLRVPYEENPNYSRRRTQNQIDRTSSSSSTIHGRRQEKIDIEPELSKPFSGQNTFAALVTFLPNKINNCNPSG